jgi:hypothetical protein
MGWLHGRNTKPQVSTFDNLINKLSGVINITAINANNDPFF